jgi:hypothetical protein
MNKQTALEWFKENLKEYSTPSLIEIDWDEFNQLFEQALAMEKEQMINAYYNGTTDEIRTKEELFFEAEHFYNETYGGNK